MSRVGEFQAGRQGVGGCAFLWLHGQFWNPCKREGLATDAEETSCEVPGILGYDCGVQGEAGVPKQCCLVFSPSCQVTICLRTGEGSLSLPLQKIQLLSGPMRPGSFENRSL